MSINTPTSFVAFFLVYVLLCGRAAAREESIGTSSCTRYNALTLIQQQIDLTKTFDDDDARRVAVLIRAADLMWPYQQKKARSAFVDAFETAMRHFRKKGDAPARDGKLLIGLPDQRYTVISAIARRDSAWARKLTDQLLKEQREDADGEAIKHVERDIRTAERLLTMAASLVSTNEAVAVNFAHSSLQYPATFYLSQFLYQLASANRAAADQFYQQALPAYANAPIERFLYLSSYPFGNDREAGEMPGSTVYQVPNGFVPNPNLQRLFVETLIRRAQDYINNPQLASEGRLSEPEQMWLALTRLERQIQESLPHMAAAVEAARKDLYAFLSQDSQRNAVETLSRDNPPKRSFNEQIETALKNPNVDRRDQQLTSAIITASKDESLDRVLEAVDKISDSMIRQPLLNWLYFDRAQRAIKDQKLDEARKLAAKVEELDQRAFLYFRVADESLKRNSDQSEAREILEEVVTATAKAPNTVVTARALLGVAYLYSKLDPNRAVAVMAEAIKLINRIEQADFSRQFVIRKIEGKTFGTYASFVTPGFNPENAFREIGKVDFDGMLNQASNVSDKSLRAMSILMLVERCLKNEVPRADLNESKLQALSTDPRLGELKQKRSVISSSYFGAGDQCVRKVVSLSST